MFLQNERIYINRIDRGQKLTLNKRQLIKKCQCFSSEENVRGPSVAGRYGPVI